MDATVAEAFARSKRKANAKRKAERHVSRKFNLVAEVEGVLWQHRNIGPIKLNELVNHYRSIRAKVSYDELTSYADENAVVNVPVARKAHVEQMSEVPYSGGEAFEDPDFKRIPKMAEFAARKKANEEYRKLVTKDNGKEIVHNKFKVFRKSDSTLMFISDIESDVVKFMVTNKVMFEDIILYAPDNIIRKLEKIGA
jgi:hypothetical protein